MLLLPGDHGHKHVFQAGRHGLGRYNGLSRRAGGAAHVIAWTLAMAALGNTDTAMREEAARVAREALAIDPRSRYALNALELTLWQQIVFGGAADRKAVFDECMRLVATVIRMDQIGRAHV